MPPANDTVLSVISPPPSRRHDARAPREEARPIDGGADPDGGRPRGGRGADDERSLPDVRARMARRDELLVRERDGGAVHAETLGELARRGQLHAVTEVPLADQALEVRLDLA